MDELQISGRRFISSRRAAKEHKYHSDYIGQLIRGGKVVGQKVGRAWYVEASSLEHYLGNEGASAPESAYVPEKEVAPVVRPEVTPEVVVAKEERVPKEEPAAVVTFVQEPTPATLATEVVAEKLVEEKIHRVPLHTPAPSSSRYPGDKKQTTITYIADDAPLMPIANTYAHTPVATEVFVDDTREVQGSLSGYGRNTQTYRKSGRGNVARFGFVGVLAVAVMAVVVGVSFFTSYNMSVEGGQMTASVHVAGMSL